MKQNVRYSLMIIIAVVTAIVCAVTPVSADRGRSSDQPKSEDSSKVDTSAPAQSAPGATTHDATDDKPVTSTTKPSDSSGRRSNDNAQAVKTEDGADHKLAELKTKADDVLKDKREDRPERPAADRKLSCEQRKPVIDSKLKLMNDKAAEHLALLNRVNQKVQGYVSDKQLTIANYDSLIADATAKQSAATAAVGALSSVSGSVDCSAADPAAAVAAARSGAADAKQALKDYREAVKAILSAAKQASRQHNEQESQR